MGYFQKTKSIITNSSKAGIRIFKNNGKPNTLRIGVNKFASYNIYHLLVNINWITFFVWVFLYFLFISVLFATCYYLIDGYSLKTIKDNYLIWIDKFFFTVQTLTAGQSKVTNNFTNLLSSFISLVGLLTFAIITGLLYGRFSKPTARLFYSENVIVNFSGKNAIYNMRIANAKISQLTEVNAQLIIGLDESINGISERKFHYVNLLSNSITFLNTSWTISHIADKESPLYNLTLEDLKNKNVEFIIFIKAIDDAYASEVQTRIAYDYSDIKWGTTFESISQVKDSLIITWVKDVNSHRIIN